MDNMWYKSEVFKGDQTGRTIQFPTVNLDPTILSNGFKQGVYAAVVNYKDKLYKGALYFGPRLVVGETKNVLEINIFDFDKEIYGEIIDFQIKDFIRGVKNFPSFKAMKEQLEDDKQKVKDSFTA